MEISPVDARRLNLADGDQAKVVSASNEEGVWDLGPSRQEAHDRPDPRYGRACAPGWWPSPWATATGPTEPAPWSLMAWRCPADARRATGIHANAAMRVDPVLKNTGLVDLVGGSAVFYQSQVKLVKV